MKNNLYSIPLILRLSAFICGFILFASTSCNAAERWPKVERIESTKGMVVCVSPPAAEVGVAVLRQGGNAVDAAVAVALAMAVTWPEAGNIGGGGFMMIWPGDGKREPTCIEYRETAPAACRADTFVNEDNTRGPKAAGVPGTIRGLQRAHQRFGKLPWRELVLPAVRLAREGFALDAGHAANLNTHCKKYKDLYPEFVRVFAKPDGSDWSKGDMLKLPDLAETLQRLADHGPDEFYTGRTAELIADDMRQNGGFITLDDLRAYKSVERTPVRGSFRGYDIHSSALPGSGGTLLVTMLNVLENFPLRDSGRYSPRTLHLVTEAQRRAYADRIRYLGDPDFVEIPSYLTTKEHGKELAATIDLEHATPSAEVAPEVKLAAEGESTTHFSVIDASGMAVANTYTLQGGYGSFVVPRGAGFILNNEMTDFNWRPGVTDRTGRVGTPPNQIAPGKRMLSSQAPTFLSRDGKLVLITGSPGGRTIPNTVLNVVLNVAEFEMDIDAAVDAPRTHHQWMPDVLKFEGTAWDEHAATVDALRKMGHVVDGASGRQGDAHSILIRDGRRYGAADTRRNPGGAAAE